MKARIPPRDIILYDFLQPEHIRNSEWVEIVKVIEHNAPITESRAKILSLAFGTTYEFWLKLQKSYDGRKANDNHHETACQGLHSRAPD